MLVNGCYLCKRDAESCNHIVLWCPFACLLWTLSYSLLGINGLMAGSVRDEIRHGFQGLFLRLWFGLFRRKEIRKILRGLNLVLINSMTFVSEL